MVSKEEIAEINAYFRGRMAESKMIWSTRGKDVRIAAHAAGAASGPTAKTWHQMSEMPFVVGFGFCAVLALWAQTKFTDEIDMRKESLASLSKLILDLRQDVAGLDYSTETNRTALPLAAATTTDVVDGRNDIELVSGTSSATSLTEENGAGRGTRIRLLWGEESPRPK
ncbi:hypothetical protein ACHAW5_009873 [Stephanodiscus triporus]|uniref:Uncharacterized protein n=1 Tax=Stephanodiscus triporus TaxID=2934178 RepID=A0ABD3Q927_9STRA